MYIMEKGKFGTLGFGKCKTMEEVHAEPFYPCVFFERINDSYKS
jgi:hypothetical protein